MHSLSHPVNIDVPYVPSFLSFREAPFYKTLFDALPSAVREQIQLVFVDGNGRLHSRQAGSAVAIGQALDKPTIGVAKEYFPIMRDVGLDEEGGRTWQTSQKGMREHCRALLKDRGDWLDISLPADDVPLGAVSSSGSSKNRFLRERGTQSLITSPNPKSRNPVFVSSGHRVSLGTALQLTLACCSGARVPEPIRLADRIGLSTFLTLHTTR